MSKTSMYVHADVSSEVRGCRLDCAAIVASSWRLENKHAPPPSGGSPAAAACSPPLERAQALSEEPRQAKQAVVAAVLVSCGSGAALPPAHRGLLFLHTLAVNYYQPASIMSSASTCGWMRGSNITPQENNQPTYSQRGTTEIRVCSLNVVVNKLVGNKSF